MSKTVIDFFYEIFYLRADVRTRDKFLMGSPVGILVIVTCYVVITKYLLNSLKSSKERCLNPISLFFCFNTFVIVMSSYFFYEIAKYMIYSNYNIRCMPLDEGTNNETMQVLILNMA